MSNKWLHPFSRFKQIWKRCLRYNPRLSCRVASRAELLLLLNAHALTDEGVEVGVHCGVFSEVILSNWQGRKLYCVDPWQQYEGLKNASDKEHVAYYHEALKRLAQFPDRFEIIRSTSEKAVSHFTDASLDFVYIDALHTYDAVKTDIVMWYPKVKPGGVLAGHDYLDGRFYDEDFGVKRAVDEFAATTQITIFVTKCKDWPSWFFFKP